MSNIISEAEAFDERISERIENGLVPDIRHEHLNKWFYNNPWRRHEYVDMVFGDYFRFACEQIPETGKVLEIGSGLGHMTLEFARKGYDVTGLELSSESVKVAQNYYDSLDKSKIPGKLKYANADFMTWEPTEKYDAICFFLTLHHFSNPTLMLQKVVQLLNPNGVLTIVEPARDLFSERNSAIVSLITGLLSITGNWYRSENLPVDESQLAQKIRTVYNEYTEAHEENEDEQSPNDNDCYSADMLEAAKKYFNKIVLKHGNSLVPRLVGGIRADDDQTTMKIANFVKLFDEYCTKQQIIEPGVMYYAGRLK